MGWNNLKTNYKNVKYSGLRKYRQISNTDNTVSFEDVTTYQDLNESLIEAADVNAITQALNAVGNKVGSEVMVLHTMVPSGWVSGEYSFETSYPPAQWDVEIALDGSATVEQSEAFGSAEMVGFYNRNKVKAKGSVPNIPIPIILKAVRKWV